VHKLTELLWQHQLTCDLLPSAQLIKQVWVALPDGSVTTTLCNHVRLISHTIATPVFPPQDPVHIA